MKRFVYALCTVAAVALATPAAAANDDPPLYLGGSAPCTAGYVNSGIACNGYYSKNLLQGDVGDATPDDIVAILNALLRNPGFTPNNPAPTPTDQTAAYVGGSYTAVDFDTILGKVENQANGDASFNFPLLNLSGLTLFGAHFGQVADPGATEPNSITAFWLLDLGSPGSPLHDITVSNALGVSNARVYATGLQGTPRGGVPEPGTWAMMLLGFVGMGMTIRRRTTKALRQLA